MRKFIIVLGLCLLPFSANAMGFSGVLCEKGAGKGSEKWMVFKELGQNSCQIKP